MLGSHTYHLRPKSIPYLIDNLELDALLLESNRSLLTGSINNSNNLPPIFYLAYRFSQLKNTEAKRKQIATSILRLLLECRTVLIFEVSPQIHLTQNKFLNTYFSNAKAKPRLITALDLIDNVHEEFYVILKHAVKQELQVQSEINNSDLYAVRIACFFSLTRKTNVDPRKRHEINELLGLLDDMHLEVEDYTQLLLLTLEVPNYCITDVVTPLNVNWQTLEFLYDKFFILLTKIINSGKKTEEPKINSILLTICIRLSQFRVANAYLDNCVIDKNYIIQATIVYLNLNELVKLKALLLKYANFNLPASNRGALINKPTANDSDLNYFYLSRICLCYVNDHIIDQLFQLFFTLIYPSAQFDNEIITKKQKELLQLIYKVYQNFFDSKEKGLEKEYVLFFQLCILLKSYQYHLALPSEFVKELNRYAKLMEKLTTGSTLIKEDQSVIASKMSDCMFVDFRNCKMSKENSIRPILIKDSPTFWHSYVQKNNPPTKRKAEALIFTSDQAHEAAEVTYKK